MYDRLEQSAVFLWSFLRRCELGDCKRGEDAADVLFVYLLCVEHSDRRDLVKNLNYRKTTNLAIARSRPVVSVQEIRYFQHFTLRITGIRIANREADRVIARRGIQV